MAMIQVTKIEKSYVEAPGEDATIVFLAHRGWIKEPHVPKYRKEGRTVNLKFMADLVAIVADVEGVDSFTVVKLINDFEGNK